MTFSPSFIPGNRPSHKVTWNSLTADVCFDPDELARYHEEKTKGRSWSKIVQSL